MNTVMLSVLMLCHYTERAERCFTECN